MSHWQRRQALATDSEPSPKYYGGATATVSDVLRGSRSTLIDLDSDDLATVHEGVDVTRIDFYEGDVIDPVVHARSAYIACARYDWLAARTVSDAQSRHLTQDIRDVE